MIDVTELIRIFLSKNIIFGRLRQSATSKLFPLLLAMLPFVYLALTYRMLGRMMGHGDDGVGKQGKQKGMPLLPLLPPNFS